MIENTPNGWVVLTVLNSIHSHFEIKNADNQKAHQDDNPQEIGSKDLEGSFPSMEQLGLGLVTILDQLRIRT